MSDPVSLSIKNASAQISVGAGAEYSLDGGPYTAMTQTISADATLHVRLTSSTQADTTVMAAINVGTQQAQFSVKTRADVTAPTAVINFPPKVSLTEGDKITLHGTAQDNGTISKITAGGVTATSADNFAHWELKDVPLINGANDIQVATEDALGNKNTNAAKVTVTRGDLTQAFPANGGVDFVGPQTVAWDNLGGRNRALVVDVAAKALLAVDLNTGVRSVLSDNTTQTDFPFFYDQTDYIGAGIVLDKDSSYAYVINSTDSYNNGGILTINLDDGKRNKTVAVTDPHFSDLAIESSIDFRRLFSCDSDQGTVYSWDFSQLKFNDFSESLGGVPDFKYPFDNSGGIAVDNARKRLLMTSLYGGAFIYAIDITYDQYDLKRGARSIFSDATHPSALNPFTASGDVVLPAIRVDAERSRALVIDRLKSTIFSVALSDDPLIDGERQIFSNGKAGINAFVDIYSLDIQSGMPFILVVDKGQKALLAVDVENGERVFVAKSQN